MGTYLIGRRGACKISSTAVYGCGNGLQSTIAGLVRGE